ncbi:PPE family protein [Mycobacterium sp. M1]|uniref:PPE family protein n=1 Tax=Mycolicibacter acidiphilus TaxID=2835306 RepID=A0ABS5RPK6_9MYCO|nr:PPE family protein [Mycolicibacter acidiphilus]MBS9536233.1 PPE family protein [Mycolicibacter acidiphilus]
MAGGLPPEVVSGRLYAGAGSGSLMAAASAWDRLAATLGSAASSYSSVVSGLVDGAWQGPGSAAMAAAAQPYIEWMTALAGQAATTAGQVRAAAAAFEAAHAGAVPPAAVAANRSELSSLVSGNVLGQNSGLIATNQAEYSAMWAQDAAVMQTYAAGSAAATKSLPPLTAAPQTTNGTAGAAPSSNPLMEFLNNNPVESFLNSPAITGWETLFNNNTGLLVGGLGAPTFDAASIMLGGPNFPVNGAVAAALSYGAFSAGMPELASATTAAPDAAPFTLAGAHQPGIVTNPTAALRGAASVPREVLAGVAQAAPVGELSVPPSWNAATPQGIRLAAHPLPSTGFPAVPHAALTGRSGLHGGLPAVVGVVNAPRKAKPAKESAGDTRQRAAASEPVVTGGRGELERLREAVAELTRRRDAMADTAVSRIEKSVRS